MPSIKVRLVGGFGNQLFGTIAGIYLAKRSNRTLKLNINDVSYSHSEFDIRSYDIGNVFIEHPNSKGRYFSVKLHIRNILEYRLRKIIPKIRILFPIYYDSGFEENSRMKPSARRVIYFRGYFQDLRYFDAIENEFRESFRLMNQSQELKSYLKKIQDSESIALHVRRGDFVAAKKYHGCLDSSWYEKVFIDNPTLISKHEILWIFSNDIEWCKSNLTFVNQLGFKEVVYLAETDLADPAEVFHLFGTAATQICANSTFSILAARLGKNSNVILPKRLNLNGEFKALEDSVPPHWNTVEPIWEK